MEGHIGYGKKARISSMHSLLAQQFYMRLVLQNNLSAQNCNTSALSLQNTVQTTTPCVEGNKNRHNTDFDKVSDVRRAPPIIKRVGLGEAHNDFKNLISHGLNNYEFGGLLRYSLAGRASRSPEKRRTRRDARFCRSRVQRCTVQNMMTIVSSPASSFQHCVKPGIKSHMITSS